MTALKDANLHVRKMAALALGDVGAAAAIAVPALIAAPRDEEEAVRRRVAVALREIAAAAPEAAPQVAAALATPAAA